MWKPNFFISCFMKTRLNMYDKNVIPAPHCLIFVFQNFMALVKDSYKCLRFRCEASPLNFLSIKYFHALLLFSFLFMFIVKWIHVWDDKLCIMLSLYVIGKALGHGFPEIRVQFCWSSRDEGFIIHKACVIFFFGVFLW